MKPDTHENITRFALSYVDKFISADSSEARWLIAGTKKEDDPTLSRGKNWHFYPANKTISKKRLWLIQPTSLSILRKREDDLLKSVENGTSEEIYITLGRIIHHIQDMSTPTHVVPVYHAGGKSSDPFELYLVEKWDEIQPQIQTEFKPNIENESDRFFTGLYMNSGKRLLEKLNDGQGLFPLEHNQTGVSISSESFWKEYGCTEGIKFTPPLWIKGFGKFGKYGISFNDAGLDEQINRVKVASFFMSFAVWDTVTALEIFRDRIIAK